MTPDELRQLDAQVAERVFHHELRTCDITMLLAYHREWVYEGEKFIWQPRDGYQSEVYLPHYSTEIADAMLVVDKLMEQSHQLMMSTHVNQCGQREWRVMVYPFHGASAGVTYAAESLPLAICRAALLAVGG